MKRRTVSDAIPTDPLAPMYRLADLFCGCGGLSLGFSLTRRFQVVLGSDVKESATNTFARNHHAASVTPTMITTDIRNLTESDLLKALRSHGIDGPGKLECLVGGPPCEGFSQNRSLGAGGRPGGGSRIDKFIEDPRNYLFKWFVRIAAFLQPTVVVIENVPDLVRHRDGETREEILAALASAGYTATVRVLNAADYGVPQMRRRAFFLAQRRIDYEASGLPLDFPKPTHCAYPLLHDSLNGDPGWLPGDSGYWPTVREAIGDLPPAFSSDDFDHATVSYPDVPLTALRRFLRSTPPGEAPFNHLARPLGKNGLRRLRALGAGGRADSLPDDLRPRAYYHYSYARLRWAEPARTITKFVYHVGSGMFTHPTEERAITMREAARLQTFPDRFRFYSSTIRDLSALVGSAVPPLLAFRIGQRVLQYLDALRHARLTPHEKRLVRKQPTDAVLRRMEHGAWSSEEPRVIQRPLFPGSDATLEQPGEE